LKAKDRAQQPPPDLLHLFVMGELWRRNVVKHRQGAGVIIVYQYALMDTSLGRYLCGV